MKGESLFRMAAFGWSAAWKPSGRDQERPPHVILIQRLVETAQTLIQMQPQGIHFPPRLNANFSKVLRFVFSPPSLSNSMAFLGSNKGKLKQFQNKHSLCWVWTSNILWSKNAKSHQCKNTNKYQNTTWRNADCWRIKHCRPQHQPHNGPLVFWGHTHLFTSTPNLDFSCYSNVGLGAEQGRVNPVRRRPPSEWLCSSLKGPLTVASQRVKSSTQSKVWAGRSDSAATSGAWREGSPLQRAARCGQLRPV